MTATTKQEPIAGETDITARWGAATLGYGFTAFPDLIFKHQKRLGLEQTDVLVLLHLASYWREASKNPFPSKSTIADAMNVDPRTVQRSIARMEKKGYVIRIARKARDGDNKSNEYDLRGMVLALTKLAKALAADDARVKAHQKARTITPKTLALVNSDQ